MSGSGIHCQTCRCEPDPPVRNPNLCQFPWDGTVCGSPELALYHGHDSSCTRKRGHKPDEACHAYVPPVRS